jgi:glycosyltransferase involved in cell wall biosynthesis
MDIFFAGNPFGNFGPRIVNDNLIRNLRDEVSYITCEKQLPRFFEVVWKILRCKVAIFSGVTSYDQYIIPIFRIMRKRVIYIMHGFLQYEDLANGFSNPRGEKNEALLLKYSDIILCVSETFMQFIKNQLPEYSHKVSFLTNGVDWEMLNHIPENDIPRDPRSIVLLGGGRITKRNLEVCKAVNLLNQRFGENYRVDVYGEFWENDASKAISEMPATVFHPLIPHEELLKVMKGASLFVQNSDIESFSLGVVEALACGCSLLISNNVGAKDILHNLTEEDIITNTTDIEQIAGKIRHLSTNGNNSRLLASIDKEETSIQTSARKLLEIAHSIM